MPSGLIVAQPAADISCHERNCGMICLPLLRTTSLRPFTANRRPVEIGRKETALWRGLSQQSGYSHNPVPIIG